MFFPWKMRYKLWVIHIYVGNPQSKLTDNLVNQGLWGIYQSILNGCLKLTLPLWGNCLYQFDLMVAIQQVLLKQVHVGDIVPIPLRKNAQRMFVHVYPNWLVAWNISYFSISWEQSLQLTKSYFRGVGIPPTRSQKGFVKAPVCSKGSRSHFQDSGRDSSRGGLRTT